MPRQTRTPASRHPVTGGAYKVQNRDYVMQGIPKYGNSGNARENARMDRVAKQIGRETKLAPLKMPYMTQKRYEARARKGR